MQDVCMFYCMEAEKYISQMSEMSIYASVFEATEGEPTAVAEETKNIELGAKSESLIRKAINALKAVYQGIKNAIGNMIGYLKLKPDDKQMYDEFVKKCKEDPALANKKVTVKDWKAIEAKFAEVRSEIEKEIEKAKRSEEDAKPTIVKALQAKVDSCEDFAEKALIKVTADQLIARAKFNKNLAYGLQSFVDNDIVILNKMEMELGKHEVNKMKRKLKRINNPLSLMNLKAKLFKKESNLEAQAMKEERAIIRSFLLSSLNSTRKYGGGVKKAASVAKFGAGIAADAHKDVRSAKKQRRKLKRVKFNYENPTVGDKIKAHGRNAKNSVKKKYHNTVDNIDLGKVKD